MIKNKELMKQVLEELDRAEEKFSGFNSTHEGYAVILEELDELWDAIKTNPNKIKVYANSINRSEIQREEHYKMMRSEAIQVGAMSLMFIKFLDEKYIDME